MQEDWIERPCIWEDPNGRPRMRDDPTCEKIRVKDHASEKI